MFLQTPIIQTNNNNKKNTLLSIFSVSNTHTDVTYTARGSVKTSVWMCIIRSPPAVYSMTKHTCSGVWKHANRLTRNGWCDMFTISKMRFSHIRLQERNERKSGEEADKGGTCNRECKDVKEEVRGRRDKRRQKMREN